jgi:regulatory protein
MVVTNIQRQQRHPDRVSIWIDGEFSFGLSGEVWLTYGLRKGDTISRETYDALAAAEEYSRARQTALRFLSYRMRTEDELRRRLREDEYPPSLIDTVLERLRTAGLVNDLEFAKAFLRDARLKKPSGLRLLRRQLLQHGVPPALVTEVLQDPENPVDEESSALEAARRAIKRKAGSRGGADRVKERQKLGQYLARRGFGWPVISRVLKVMFPALPTPEDSE